MKEQRAERQFQQTRIDGHVFRFTKRVYDVGNGDVLAILRIFDGDPANQGFWVVDRGRKIRGHENSWKEIEENIAQALRYMNGGSKPGL